MTEVSPKFMPDEIEINGVIYVRKTEKQAENIRIAKIYESFAHR